MPNRRRIEIAKNEIISFFSGIGPLSYSENQLCQILSDNKKTWALASYMTAADFISFLISEGKLRKKTLRANNYDKELTRYIWGNATSLQVALSIKTRSYLSHATALKVHDINVSINSPTYVNAEQTPKPKASGKLSQEGINRAFAGKQRYSNLSYNYENKTITLIAGKNTNRLGVESYKDANGANISATNLERTLVDIVVRPTYAGGPKQVFEAYRAAKTRISGKRLLETLAALDYAYPYHQSIGFLMQRTGHLSDEWKLFQKSKLHFDFYLTHGVKELEYCPEWRLFYPKNMLK